MGIFVTIEGPNGVGKSTFIQRLEQALSSQYTLFMTKEPSPSNFGEYVRNNEDSLKGDAYAYLIAADRCYHLQNFIEPELEKGKLVISDRYIESSFVLQAFDGVSTEDIWRLNCKFTIPDLSIVLLASESIISSRLSLRNKLTNYEKKMSRKDEIEGYKKAVDYLKSKDYPITVFYNNSEIDLENNLKKVHMKVNEIAREKNAENN